MSRARRCRFCGCSERRPCLIPASYISDPDFRPRGNVVPCAWLLPDVCTAPGCVERAYQEAAPLADSIMLRLAASELIVPELEVIL